MAAALCGDDASPAGSSAAAAAIGASSPHCALFGRLEDVRHGAPFGGHCLQDSVALFLEPDTEQRRFFLEALQLLGVRR